MSSEPVDFALLRDYYLARSLLDQGASAAARACAITLIERARELQIRRQEGRGHWILAEIHARSSDLDSAEREILLALEQMPEALVHHLFAQVTLASIRLAQGRTEEALRLADAARLACAARGIGWLNGRLVYAEALEATGSHERACAVLAEAHADLLVDAEKIGAPALQRSFLKKIPEHARIVQLAVTWNLSPPAPPSVGASVPEDSRPLSFPASPEVQPS